MADNQANVTSSTPRAAHSPPAGVVTSQNEPPSVVASRLRKWGDAWHRAWRSMSDVARQAEAPATKAWQTLGQTTADVWRPARGRVSHAKQEATHAVASSWQRLHPRLSTLQQRVGHGAAASWQTVTKRLSASEKRASQSIFKAWRRMRPSARNLRSWVGTAMTTIGRGPAQLGARAWGGAARGMSLVARRVKRKLSAGDARERTSE